MKKPTYFETVPTNSGTSYLFSKRLNPKLGTFPLFKDKFKKKLYATSEAEAAAEALTLSNELEHLQVVCRRDAKNLPTSLKDMTRAAKTWTSLVCCLDIEEVTRLKGKKTLLAIEAKEGLSLAIDEVIDYYGQAKQHASGDLQQWLSAFGDHLLAYLKEGEQAGTILDAVPIYLKQTNRDHLPENAKAVRDTQRTVKLFAEVVGEKPLDQISRKDVERYISKRLEDVKTTSVERELGTLSSVWHKASLVLDIRQQNPFAEQSIRGLGTDSVKRKTPSLEEMQTLLVALEERYRKYPTSYVSSLPAIAALMGMRLAEAWGLKETDWEKDSLLYGTSTLFIRENSKRTTLKTQNSNRPFPVLPELAVWLERYFACTHAKNANSASAATLSALRHLGFDFGNHSIRHGFRERLKEANAPLDVVEELQGWSSQRMSAYYGSRQSSATKVSYLKAVYAALMPQVNDSGNVIHLTRAKNF